MSQASGFKTREGEARFLAAYDAEMKRWPVPYEEIDVPTRFGRTHVVVCGSKTAPPLVLLATRAPLRIARLRGSGEG